MDRLMYIHTAFAVFVFEAGKCKAVQDAAGEEPLLEWQNDLRGASLQGIVPATHQSKGPLLIAYICARNGQEEDPQTLSPLVEVYRYDPDARSARWMMKLKLVTRHNETCYFGPIESIRAAPQTVRVTLDATPAARHLTPAPVAPASAPPSGVHAPPDASSSSSDGEDDAPPEADAS